MQKTAARTNGHKPSFAGVFAQAVDDAVVVAKKDKRGGKSKTKSGKKTSKAAQAARSAVRGKSRAGVAAAAAAGDAKKGFPASFESDFCDHFETSSEAYRDVLPVLEYICEVRGKTLSELVVWDPFFCTGKAVSRLKALGVGRVINQDRDFYKTVKAKKVPKHDVLITNPPFSGSHKERTFEFCMTGNRGRPWLVLLPSYVASKKYYRELPQQGHARPFFVKPTERYEFDHPLEAGHDTSPFFSMWFCHLGALDSKRARTELRSRLGDTMVEEVTQLVRQGVISGQKRRNPKQRRRARKRMQQQVAQQQTG